MFELEGPFSSADFSTFKFTALDWKLSLKNLTILKILKYWKMKNSTLLLSKQMRRFDEYVVHIIDPTGSTRFEVVLCQSIIHEYEEVWYLY